MSKSSVLFGSLSDRYSAVRWSSIFSSWRLLTLRRSKRMARRYHVLDTMGEWLTIKGSSIETVVVQEAKIPRFEFNVKIITSSRYRDFYIPNSVIVALKEIKAVITSKGIEYKPSHHIVKFAFDYIESRLPNAPKVIARRYPQPVDSDVAMAVVTQLFQIRDTLNAESEELVVYYYLCVLRAVDHPVINHARFVVNDCADGPGVYNSAVIPRSDRPNCPMTYYALYADLIYFLSLLAPPCRAADNTPKITAKVRSRHAEQIEILCRSIGITKYQPIHRGEGWCKVSRFFEANPLVGRVLATTILKPPEIDVSLTVLEDQVLKQTKQLWKWTGLEDFRDCYEFASNAHRTEAHQIPIIAEQCEVVVLLYQKLKAAVAEETLVPYAKLLIDGEHFFDQYEASNFPELFYACRASMTPNKSGNSLWEEFVATRKVTIPRKEIDEKLMISLPRTLGALVIQDDEAQVAKLPLENEEVVDTTNNTTVLCYESDHFGGDNMENMPFINRRDSDSEFVIF